MSTLANVPADFLTALGSLRAARTRSELRLAEVPAPSRLAPFAVALGAEVMNDGDELATGRFILLHDPHGSALWEGTFRIVTYIRAELDADMGNDTLLGNVAWTWLLEALETRDAAHRNAGGTATRILSESFGSLAARPETIDLELRASWTPEGSAVRSHLEAWSDMVCSFAGLPPLPDGVTALVPRRHQG